MLLSGAALKRDDMPWVELLAQKTPQVLEEIWVTDQSNLPTWIKTPGFIMFRYGVFTQLVVVMASTAVEKRTIPFLAGL